MTTWCGHSREGRTVFNNQLTCSDTNITSTTASTDCSTTSAASASAINTTVTIGTDIAGYTSTIWDTDSGAIGPPAVCDYFTALDYSNHQNLPLGGAIPSPYPVAALPSSSVNDSFFATVGNSLPRHFRTAPDSSSLSLLPIGGFGHGDFHVAPLATTLGAPLPTPLVLGPPNLLPPPTIPSFGQPGYLSFPGFPGGFYPYVHTPNCLPQTSPDIQGNGQSGFPVAAPSFSSFATTPAIFPPLHMSNVNPRPAASISQAERSSLAEAAQSSIDDQYLASLATGDFSSPSLPPLSNLPSPTTLSPFGRSSWATAGQEMPPPAARRRPANRGGAADLTKREPDFDSTNSTIDPSIPAAPTMPPMTRRRSLASGTSPGARKRRPPAATSPSNRPNKTRRKVRLDHENDPSPFDDDDLYSLDDKLGSEPIDLSNATEVPAELLAPKVDNRVKLGKFQCVICMDDTTALTVTHCGHLFCSECLHSALHIDTIKRTCPVCRSKVELKGVKKTAKSFYHLELKVMTKTKMGKRPADI